MQPAEAVSPLSHLPSVFKHLVPVSVVYLVVFYTRFLTLPPIQGEKKKKKLVWLNMHLTFLSKVSQKAR